jgi:hypothetical protein
VRWIVEVLNGRLKSQFRHFDHRLQNKVLLHTGDDMRFACAVLNLRYKPILSDGDNENVAIRMLKIQETLTTNALNTFVIANNYDKVRKNQVWHKMD